MSDARSLQSLPATAPHAHDAAAPEGAAICGFVNAVLLALPLWALIGFAVAAIL